ncbi:MAG: fluoride efflux transporter CrcB [Acidimicrobiales bacterium]
MIAVASIAGGLGAGCRYLGDRKITQATKSRFPYGTLAINLTGALLLGLMTGLSSDRIIPHDLEMVLGTGFLGGYTTFSTFVYETYFLLVRRGTRSLGLANLSGSLIGGLLLFAAGLEAALALHR